MDEIGEKKATHIIRIGSAPDFGGAIDRAGEYLLTGRVVAFPSESFYGLAVDARSEEAIRRLFWLKRRRSDRPILVLLPSVEILGRYVSIIPQIACQLIEAFWPGGLTLVFQAGSKISPLLTAGTGKIGVRLSSHPVATALAQSIGVPITGTSANISEEDACRTAAEVSGIFGERLDLILDGGETSGKIGSTVLDVTVHPPRILREGMVSQSQLRKFIGP